MQNQRKRTRIDGQYKGFLTVQGREVPFHSLNLSLKGLLCQTSVPLPPGKTPPGTTCTVTIPLAQEAVITVEASIVRIDDVEVAIDFKGMDEQSYRHLANCVRLMSEDPDAIEREQAIPAFKGD